MKNLVITGVCAAIVSSSVQASLLHDNGGFVTNPTGGTSSIAGQPISQCDPFYFPNNPFGFSTTGVGAAASLDNALADDFTVTGQGWNLDSLTVYAFQTSQTSASVTSVRINLWNAAPYNAGSPGTLPNPLPQPLFANDLVLPAGTGTFIAHRQSPTGTATNRPVFAYTVSLDGLPDQGQLAPGNYWIEWSFDGPTTPSAFIYTPLVTPRTQTDDWNARQYSSLSGQPADPRVWFEGREGYQSELVPGRAFELPFILNGTLLPEPGALSLIGLTMMVGSRRRRSK